MDKQASPVCGYSQQQHSHESVPCTAELIANLEFLHAYVVFVTILLMAFAEENVETLHRNSNLQSHFTLIFLT